MAKKKDAVDAELHKKLAGLSTEEALDEFETDVDEELELSAEEKAELEAEAKAEVAKELKAEKMRAFKEAAKQAAKRTALFRHGKDEAGENTETVLVSLAQHTPFIQLDGKRYYNGHAYRLNAGTAAVLKDQMHRGELHENEIHGKNMKDFYLHRPQRQMIGPNTPINLPAGF